jgi:glycosyltransferase involved in cell wall biosynthesis
MGVAESTILGISVGKFGDIYYDREAFQVFAHFARRLPDFRLAVLTPMRHSSVRGLASRAGFPPDRLFVATVRHGEVARYLSAADVGFAMIRMAPSRRYCSPVKVGEYWACGLPIVITDGVGDDSAITVASDGGAVVTLAEEDLDRGVERIRRLLAEPGHRERIAEIARVHRDRRRVDEAYKRIGLL